MREVTVDRDEYEEQSKTREAWDAIKALRTGQESEDKVGSEDAVQAEALATQ